MNPRTRSLSRTLIAATAATAPVLALAPTAQAAPAPPALPATSLPAVPMPATPLPTVPLTPAADDHTTVTRTVNVPIGNVRSGPGLGYPVVTTMAQGTVVRGTWTDGWLNLGNGRFISGTILSGLTSTADPGQVTSSLVTRWVSSRVAAARSGPSTSYPITNTRTQGTQVKGTITSNGWLRISTNEYMSPSVLTNRNPGTAAAVTQYVTSSVGNVRSGPSLNHSVVTTLQQGTQVRGSWTNGWLDMGNGLFISGTILSARAPAAAPAPTPSSLVTRWVSSRVAAARSGPSTSYPITNTRTQGTQVKGTITSNGWLQISTNEYMAPSVLTDRDPGGTTSVTQYVTSSVGNVRSGPSLNHSVVTTLQQGTQVRGSWTNGWLDMGNGLFISGTILSSTNPVSAAPAPAPTTSLRTALLKTAADYVGHPYVLYGTPPNAFDCSSYTWWIYKQHGITIPRTVRDQRTAVTKVTNPQPGDLVFYNNWYHVGIYAGNGMVYEALNPSAGVVYTKMWDQDVWYGRVPGV